MTEQQSNSAHAGLIVKAKVLRTERDAQTIQMQAQAEAQGILAQAEAEASQIIEQAKAEAEALLAQAEAESAMAGRRVAARLAGEASAVAREELLGIADEVAETVMFCVRRVVDWIPEEERLAALCRKALQDQADRHRLTLTVSPVARALAGAALEHLKAEGTIMLAQSDRLPPDMAQLETPNGVIELNLRTQLEALSEALGVKPQPQKPEQQKAQSTEPEQEQDS